VRDEAYWIGREALLNAFYHSKGQKVETEIFYSASTLKLRFRDDGRGIDPKILERVGTTKHWGLVGMRERSARIGAHLALHSRVGAGTEVELVIPAAVAYIGGAHASWFNWVRHLVRQFRTGGREPQEIADRGEEATSSGSFRGAQDDNETRS
jgi:hypothetical protein